MGLNTTNNYYILALDQSTQKNGWCVLNANAEIIEYGYCDKSKNGDTTDLGHTMRRNSLREDLRKIIDKYPEIIQVVCEGTYKNNVEVYKKLCKVQGSIEDLCYDLNISCYSFKNAGEWRKFLPVKITGKRDVCKRLTKEYVLSQYPELSDNLPQDIYDAIGIGIAYLSIFIA